MNNLTAPNSSRDLSAIETIDPATAAAAVAMAEELGPNVDILRLREHLLMSGVEIDGRTLGKRQLQKLFRETPGWVCMGDLVRRAGA